MSDVTSGNAREPRGQARQCGSSSNSSSSRTVSRHGHTSSLRSISAAARIVQQTRGHRGFEAWHAIVRRFDQRNMSDKNSAYAALISNISEKDRAKDVEQFDDILRTFINEMNKFESRFGAIRDEEKMLAVKKLMLEGLLNLLVQRNDNVLQCNHHCAGKHYC